MKLRIGFFIISFIIFINPTFAAEKEFSGSGKLLAMAEFKVDERPKILKAYLESKGSPCVEFANDFIYYADKYGLDWKLGPAISGVESTFCQFYPKEYNNPFGIAGGYYYFKDLPESIEFLNKLIAREFYYRRFQETGDIYDLAIVYAESWQKWAYGVSKFMNEIDDFSPDSSTTLVINL